MNEQQLLGIANMEFFVEPSDDNDRLWFGTQFWCAQQRERRARNVKFSDLVAKAATDVELERVLSSTGSPVCVQLPQGLCRVYVRPDGEHVYLNDEYMSAVERLIGCHLEVRLLQGERLRPVAFVAGDETVGLVMPVRVS